MSAPATVAVVVKDRRLELARCLDAIIAQSARPAAVVVVDNGSTDGTLEDLEARAARGELRLLHSDGTLGRIRNVALGAVRTPLVAFTDSDCVPDPDWLAQLLEPFDDPAVDIVQGRTVPAAVDTDPFPRTQRIESFSGRFEACNVAYRTDALQAAGGFDDAIGQFGEDMAAGWRVRDLGGRAVFAPTATVRHEVTYPGRRAAVRRYLDYGAWPRLVRDHPGIRSELLWHRLFLSRRTALFDAAVGGTVTAIVRRRPGGLLLALPYLWHRRPRHRTVQAVVNLGTAVAADATCCLALVQGSIKARSVVL